METKIVIKAGSIILFQGDSITDAARDRTAIQANDTYGCGIGYCNHIISRMLRERPADNLQFYNRGISGNRIVDLFARWEVDTINLKPDLISILIGVNDTWHEFDSHSGVDPDRYEKIYHSLLDSTRRQLPSVQFVLCEPFILDCGVVTAAWEAEMAQRRRIVKHLANEHGAVFVPFQSALNDVLKIAPAEYWTIDGVHPTLAGHQILAECWYENVVMRSMF